jgi:hypothetical protein
LGSEGIEPPFLTTALGGSNWSASRSCRRIAGETGLSRHFSSFIKMLMNSLVNSKRLFVRQLALEVFTCNLYANNFLFIGLCVAENVPVYFCKVKYKMWK